MADRNSTASDRVEAQLRAFIVKFRPRLLAQAVRICSNKAEAEDLVQTASERFLRDIPRLRRIESRKQLEDWLIKTMANEFISRCRKRSAEKKGRLDPTLEEITLGRPAELKRLLSELEEALAVDAAMNELSPTLRSTMELRLKSKSYQEISLIQNIPVGRVGKRLSDAREKLMSMLGPLITSRKH